MSKRHHSKIRAVLRFLNSRCRRNARCRRGLAWLPALIAITVFAASSYGAECTVSSSQHRVALLELYTSEGCNSCPPADRWLNGLQDRGIDAQQVVPLAFHVDYWDYIGWKDRFAQPAFSQRQRLTGSRNQASFIYTPQFVLDGRDFRRPWFGDDLGKKLARINSSLATVALSLKQERRDNEVRVSVRAHNFDQRAVDLFIALFQNHLNSEIKAGENAGKKLYHEFVVRELKGPFPIAPGQLLEPEIQFDLAPYRDLSTIGFAVFAERPDSGMTMQAMAASLCQSPP